MVTSVQYRNIKSHDVWNLVIALAFLGCGIRGYSGADVQVDSRSALRTQVSVRNNFAGRVEIYAVRTGGTSRIRIGSIKAYEFKMFELPAPFGSEPVRIAVEDIQHRISSFVSHSVLVTPGQRIELDVRPNIAYSQLTVRDVVPRSR